jgi:hypothetical protein
VAKAPAVIGVLTEPPQPTWWKANRHKVLVVIGLLVGYWIGTHTADASSPQPRPGHTPPATHSPSHQSSNHAALRLAAY